MEKKMFCSKCGKELTGNERFCPACGHAVNNSVDNLGVIGEQRSEKIPWSIDIETTVKKKRRWPIVILVCLVGVIFVGGIVGFLVQRNSDEYEYLAVVENENGLYGCINERKKEIIECQYNVVILNAEEGNVIVWKEKDSAGNSPEYNKGVLDTEGEVIIPIQYAQVECLNVAGETIFALAEEAGINEDGEPILNWGFANSDGEMITEFKYQYGTTTVPGASYKEAQGVIPVSCYVENGLDSGYIYGAIDSEGKEVIPLDSQYIAPWQAIGDSGLLAIERMGAGKEWKVGFVDYNNETVIPFEYEGAGNFTENGLAAVKKNNKWGYINKSGNTVIPFKYDYASDFTECGLARVESGDVTIYINENGDEIVKDSWDTANDFDENGYALVSNEMGEGLIDKNGDYVLPCGYESISTPNGLYVAEGSSLDMEGDPYVILNSNGEEVIEGLLDFDTVWGMGDNEWISIGTVYDQDEEDNKIYQCNYVNEYGDIKLRLPERYNYSSPFERIKR